MVGEEWLVDISIGLRREAPEHPAGLADSVKRPGFGKDDQNRVPRAQIIDQTRLAYAVRACLSRREDGATDSVVDPYFQSHTGVEKEPIRGNSCATPRQSLPVEANGS